MLPFRQHMYETFRLALPVAIGQLGHVLLGVTDSIMVGHVGSVHLAAAALANSAFLLLLVFAAGMASAVTPLVAIANGEGNRARSAMTMRQGLLLNGTIGIVLTLLSLGMAELLHLLGQPDNVVALAGPYLRILSFSFLPMLLFMTVRNFVDGLSVTRPAMVIMLLANVVNVGGNWILIFGNLGAPALGLDGAGYSSLAVEVFVAVAIVLYVQRSRRFREWRPMFRYQTVDRPLLLRLLRLGVPSGLQYVFEAGSFSFAAIMIGWLGSTWLAAHQVAISLAAVSYMAILGISHAAMIRVGTALGRGDQVAVRRAGFSGILMAALLMGVAAAMFILFRALLPTLYSTDADVIRYAAGLLVIAAFFQISDGIQAVGLGVLRGLTDATVPLLIAIVAYWFVGIPTGYWMAFHADMGAQGVWIGQLLGLTTAAALFVLRFHRKTSPS